MAHQHLGAQTHYHVYGAELTALRLAITQWQDLTDNPWCYIFTDSQAGSISIQKPQRQSGESITASILDCTDSILDQHLHRELHVIWIPGQCDIRGNEKADTEAKKTANHKWISPPFGHRPLSQHVCSTVYLPCDKRSSDQYIAIALICGQNFRFHLKFCFF